MTRFSASDAALEGFQVLRGHWRVVIGWCLFTVLGFVGLLVLAVIAITLTIAIALAAKAADQNEMAGTAVGGLVLGLGGAAIQWVVLAALYRLTLRPGAPPGTYYLRIGRDEIRLFGLWLVILILSACLITVGYLAVQGLTRLSGAAGGIGTLLFILLMLWLAIRTSLAGPANFATGRFGLVESWRLTRGHVWSLLGMTLLAGCLMALIAIVLFVLVAVLEAAIGGFHTLAPISLSDRQALTDRPGAYVFGLIAELVCGPLYLVIGQTPFVAAYRALSAEKA
ncbi:hypothetical protein [Phenylobacterium sp.]|uniref:hypothetical protein n=1 Tax=Phenylobacterium sp. TaxID=1871053 RepID=UPI003566CDC1